MALQRQECAAISRLSTFLFLKCEIFSDVHGWLDNVRVFCWARFVGGKLLEFIGLGNIHWTDGGQIPEELSLGRCNDCCLYTIVMMIDRTKWSGLLPNLHLELHFKLHVFQDYNKHNSEKFYFSNILCLGLATIRLNVSLITTKHVDLTLQNHGDNVKLIVLSWWAVSPNLTLMQLLHRIHHSFNSRGCQKIQNNSVRSVKDWLTRHFSD